MQNSIPFGIGSLFFEIPDASVPNIKRPEDDYLTPTEYADKVRKVLELLASVDNIDINVPIRERYLGEDPERWPHELGDGHRFGPVIPSYGDGNVAFRLHIPIRVQRELSGNSMSVEDFDVDIRFGGGFPVTFVQPVGLTSARSVSMSVFYVREFLLRELRRVKNQLGGVTFCFLGPSPFWAECILEPDPGNREEALSVVRTKVPDTYDHLRFGFSTNKFQDSVAAFEALKSVATAYFTDYYDLIHMQNLQRLRWTMIEDDLRELVRQSRVVA